MTEDALMPHILVIDDERDIRESLAILLEDRGYKISLAAHGGEGLEILRREKVDLVITDLIMPVQEGIETIRWIKKEKPDIKVIAMSGGGKVSPGSYLDIAQKLGADRIFDKPLEIEDMFTTIHELLGK